MELSLREKGIVALALGNLEKTIHSLPGGVVRWTPRLARGEVAALRRKLCDREQAHGLKVVEYDGKDCA